MVRWDSLLQVHECQHRCLRIVSSSHHLHYGVIVSYLTESLFRRLLEVRPKGSRGTILLTVEVKWFLDMNILDAGFNHSVF